MSNWFTRLFGPKAKSEQELSYEREIQTLQLELAERGKTITNLKQELERQRLGANDEVSGAVQAQVEQLFSDLAAPVTQLITQTHLLEVEEKTIQARDVLAVAKRFVRGLEDNGLTVMEQVGQTISFDPNYHEPLASDTPVLNGQKVVVRFAGVSYQGKLLRKASVSTAEET